MTELQNSIKMQMELAGRDSIRALEGIFPEAYTGRIDSSKGVFIPDMHTEPLLVKAQGIRLLRTRIIIDEADCSLLCLLIDSHSSSDSFYTIAADFIDPGQGGEARGRIISDPLAWWNEWQSLLGNTLRRSVPHAWWGEIYAFYKLRSMFGSNVRWTSLAAGVLDFEVPGWSLEVKSTLKRDGRFVEISSGFQLSDRDKLRLLFLRLAHDGGEGRSMNDLLRCMNLGAKEEEAIESYLSGQELPVGAPERDRKYKVLEELVYSITQDFPCISSASFVGGEIPRGVFGIHYLIDLDIAGTGIPFAQIL